MKSLKYSIAFCFLFLALATAYATVVIGELKRERRLNERNYAEGFKHAETICEGKVINFWMVGEIVGGECK